MFLHARPLCFAVAAWSKQIKAYTKGRQVCEVSCISRYAGWPGSEVLESKSTYIQVCKATVPHCIQPFQVAWSEDSGDAELANAQRYFWSMSKLITFS